MVAPHLLVLHEREGRCRRCGRARNPDRPLHSDGDGQPVRRPSRQSGPRMGPTELRLRDPGFRRAADPGYGRHSSAETSADLAGTLTTTLGPLVSVRTDNINSSVSGFGDLYPAAPAEMARRRQQLHGLRNRGHSGRRLRSQPFGKSRHRSWCNRRRRRLHLP